MTPIDQDLEARVQSLGLELHRSAMREQDPIWRKEYWMGKVLELATQDQAFKTQLFRFVDVFPSLQTSEQIADHVRCYFSGKGAHLPAPLDWIAGKFGGGGIAAGAVSALMARTIRKNILSMAKRFVLSQTPAEAMPALARLHQQGLLATIDLLGEKTVSEAEADAYQARYLELLDTLSKHQAADYQAADQKAMVFPGEGSPHLTRPNISIKLSTLCSRFRASDTEGAAARVKERLRPIFRKARDARIFINIDSEALASREMTRRVFEEMVEEPEFSESDLFGVVIQAYLKDSLEQTRRFIAWSGERGRKYTVRLVRGAYWDVETVLAKAQGWPVPVYEAKGDTDANFEQCLHLLMENHQTVRTALGSHNLRSISLMMALAERLAVPKEGYEFQVLFGMGEPLKKALLEMGQPVRVYTPVGDMVEGMAYLVRRLLENTSNQSVLRHQFAEGLDAETLLRPPESPVVTDPPPAQPSPAPFRNIALVDFSLEENRLRMAGAIAALEERLPLEAAPRIGGKIVSSPVRVESRNPARLEQLLGWVSMGQAEQARQAVEIAVAHRAPWRATPPTERADILRRAAEGMVTQRFDLAALMVAEAGKTWEEADADVVEAIDFLNYYAAEMERLATPRLMQDIGGETNHYAYRPKGVAVVIAPWNFPLAISTGMTAAALVAGNPVVYKPAETSSLTGQAMVDILHDAGIPPGVLGFLPGRGEDVGAALVAHPEVDLIAFTGSMEVGLGIIRQAGDTRPGQGGVKKVIAEMGGKNAIIVDEDADLDEAIRGILHSAFSFQGQKCSACSRLIVVESIREKLTQRLAAAIGELRIGPPQDPSTELGPLIDQEARDKVLRYIQVGESEGRVLARGNPPPPGGWYVAPALFGGIAPQSALAREEIFGPVVVLLSARDFGHALELANDTPFHLTGGVYSRHPEHLELARREFQVGNLYLNRPTTGAIVGRQPFGGFGMSGVGSKAGGPDYLLQFIDPVTISENTLRQGFAPD